MKHVRLVLSLAILTGCAGIIGVPDLSFEPNAVQGSPDGSAGSSGGTSGSSGSSGTSGGSSGDGGGVNCDTSKLQTDKLNCGACGHDCLGGDCTAGQCKAVPVTNVPNAPLNRIIEHGDSLYVASFSTDVLPPGSGGIWKVPKAGGPAAPYVTLVDAQDMVVSGDTLYFVSDDVATATGGLYSCDLLGAIPCVPKLITAAEDPFSLTVADGGNVYFPDDRTGKGLMQYAPGGATTVFRPGFGFVPKFWVDGTEAYYVVTFDSPPQPPPQQAKLISIFPDGGIAVLTEYDKDTVANDGEIRGTANALYFTAFDYDTTTGGVVRRINRPGTAGTTPCDFGGTKNLRPYGLYLDAKNVYWTNQGDFAQPYDNGSIAYCPLDGCCDTPTTPWTGDGEPSGITGDDKALYWTTYRTNTVWKIAKP
jgi:hypothetical protein